MIPKTIFFNYRLEPFENVLERQRVLCEDRFRGIFALKNTFKFIIQDNKIETLLPEEEYSSVTVYPKPGLCVKTKNDKGKNK